MTELVIYLAGRYDRRIELCEYRAQLQDIGFIVNSRWLDGLHVLAAGLGEKTNQFAPAEAQTWMASEDWADVISADIVINFTEPPDSDSKRGGRHVEYGAALALKKQVFIVGFRENVFHYLPQARYYESWADCWRDQFSLKSTVV